MTNQELLELAYAAEFHGAKLSEDKDMQKHWNPLVDDADAFRLMVALKMTASTWPKENQVSIHFPLNPLNDDQGFYKIEPFTDDPCTALRKMIVIGAAAYQRMKELRND